MATTSIYLNFDRVTEEAFLFYKHVFGTEFAGEIARMKDVPPQEGVPLLAEADKNLVMHVALPILGGTLLMGTDATGSMGFTVHQGNNVYISLHPDSRDEADRLFTTLSEGGVIEMPIQDMFWGDYFGSFVDKYGVRWMVNYSTKK